jgi:hypothetical protein
MKPAGSANACRLPVTDLVHFSETRLWILPWNRRALPCPYCSDSILDMSVDPSFRAQLVFRSGLAALVPGMFGMGWLGSGLGIAHAFTPIVIILFDAVGILVLGSSIYFIRKGRALRRNYPASFDPRAQRMRKQFIVVLVLEFTAIAVLSMIAYVIHRPDLAPVLAAIVVGLHFLPLGKIFRQARYYFWGIAITLWCVFCAFSFRSNMLVAWSNIGTGVLLWACCTHGLLRARGIVHSLVRQPDVSLTREI